MKKNIIILSALLLLCGCGETPTTSSSINDNSSINDETSSSQIVVENDGFTLRMFGDLYKNTSRMIYAQLDDYDGQEIYWSSSNEEIVRVSPREDLTTECFLHCKGTGKVTIVAQDSKNLNRRVAKEFIITEGEAMPLELFNKMTGGVKLTSLDQCLTFDYNYNPIVDQEYSVETIYEEGNPNDDVENTNDAYQITVTNKNNNSTEVTKYVKGVGGYVCSEFLDYNNEIKHQKVFTEDETEIKWENSYYCNLWRNKDVVTNEFFRTYDGGKTYHFSEYYLSATYLCASMYLLDMAPDDLYFVVKDNQELELHADIDPYSRNVNTPKTGRKIVTKISDVNTAKIDHLKPYEHLEIHDNIDQARQKMAALKNYKANVILDYPTGSDYRYEFTFTDDTIDVVTYKDNVLYYHEGSHKNGANSYYSYIYDDENNSLVIDKTHSQAWEAVNRYPTFDFASEIFKETSTNNYITNGDEGLFIQMCAYLSTAFSYYTFDDKGYLKIDEDGYISEVSTSVNALGERLNVTIRYSDFNNATCDIDFSNVNEDNLPTSFEKAEPQLYSNMVDWKIENVIPYLYSSVGYATGVYYRRLDDKTGVKYAYINTNKFPTNEERDSFIADYKKLLVSEGYVETTEIHEDTGYTLYKKGDYCLGVGPELNWNNKELTSVQIIVVSDLLEPVIYS